MNEQHDPLSASFAWLRARLAGECSPPPALPPSLLELREAFGLSTFESHLLLLCAGAALDGEIAGELVRQQGRGPAPTFAMASQVLPGAHWSALSPSAPLRHWRLLQVGVGETLAAAPLQLDEHTLCFLLGVRAEDVALAGMLRPLHPPRALLDSQRDVVCAVLTAWHQRRSSQAVLVQWIGELESESCTLAAAVCATLGSSARLLDSSDIPAEPSTRATLARLLEREAVLAQTVPVISIAPSRAKSALALASLLQCPCMLLTRSRLHVPDRASSVVEVPRLAEHERVGLWRSELGEAAQALNGSVERVARQFRFSATEIAAVASTLRDLPTLGERQLWSACRQQARCDLDELAERIEPRAHWNDLVLPEAQLATLREIAVHIRHRHQVLEHWGFADKSRRGLGIGALFSGPSGTGKTMAAEVLANELELELYRVDLSRVVSKYIGETEKNLARVFSAAETGGVVLLFDEADALFGRRSEVRDSHDRHANVEVSYLLQRIETYEGLALLTTNLKATMDHAFWRRLRFVVTFAHPDLQQRAEIWKGAFPAQTPTRELRWERLAQLNVAGGSIRSIALNAAFLAAESREPVGMAHLLRAARSECAKLERKPNEAELAGWT